MSWPCRSRTSTRSCSSSTVPCSRSFSCKVALSRSSSSRFRSDSILISACRLSRRMMCWLVEEFFSRKSSLRAWTCRESCLSTSDALLS